MTSLKINFSTNWNNKLNNMCFTSIRPLNYNKYKTSLIYQVCLKDNHICLAELIEIRIIRLCDFSEIQARLDTGYDRNFLIQLMQRFYKLDNYQLNTPFMYLLFKKVSKK
jgi:hypothetical protein